ncbi:hypothetical protein [Acidovorax sp. FG27]|uniref:hypothetical protein n=1 Tax=Acidovorax sp. FG27 TaxID=3133652 RepID=UPI003341E262
MLGVLVALCVSLTLALLGFPYSFDRWMIVLSTAFFFFIGIVRGAEAADTVTDALTVATVSVLGSFSAAGGGSPVVDGNPG